MPEPIDPYFQRAVVVEIEETRQAMGKSLLIKATVEIRHETTQRKLTDMHIMYYFNFKF